MQVHEIEENRVALSGDWTHSCAHGAVDADEKTMRDTRIATAFLKQLRTNIEAWREGEFDYITFSAHQQDLWTQIRICGAEVEEAVRRALESVELEALVRQMSVGAPKLAASTPRSCNRMFRVFAEAERSGSQVLRVIANHPQDTLSSRRTMAAFIFEIAAELERRSQELRATWSIFAAPAHAYVAIGLTRKEDAALAAELAASVVDSLS